MVGWLERFSLLERAPFAFMFGCILGISTPGFDLSLVAWIGLAPLLVLIRASRNIMDAALIGFIFGMGYYLVALNCYLGLFPLRWLGIEDWLAMEAVGIVWLVEAAHQALLVAAFSTLVFCLPMRSGYLVHIHRPFFPYLFSVPLIWIFLNWVVATSEPFLGLPICQLAYTQHNAIPLIQSARIAGSGVIDFMIVLSNCAIASLIMELTTLVPRMAPRTDQVSPRVGALVDVGLVALVIVAATTWGARSAREIAQQVRVDSEASYYDERPTIPIAVVQANESIEEERLKTTTATEICKRYTDLAQGKGVQILILPENAISANQFMPGLLLSKLKGIVIHEKKEAIAGTVETFGDSEISAARIVAPAARKNNIYVKQRVMPFGEIATIGPLGKLTPELARAQGGELPPDVRAASSPLLSVFGRVGVSISTELIFPGLIASQVSRGASLLVNLADLSQFHSSSLNRQVVAAATLRAVENGRFVVLAANTGISAVIDPSGVVTSMSYPGKRGVLIDTVQFIYKQTPYSRMSRMRWL